MKKYDKKTYSKSDLVYLEQNFSNTPTGQIANQLDRSIGSVRMKANSIGLFKTDKEYSNFYRFWTDSELDFLKQNADLSVSELMIKLDRSFDSIKNKMSELNLTGKRHSILDPAKRKYLKNNIGKMSDLELAEKLNLSKVTVRDYRSKLKNTGKLFSSNSNNWHWSVSDDEFLINNYKQMQDCEIAQVLNRTTYSIANRRVVLGLEKKRKKVSLEEKQFIIENFDRLTILEIAKALNRPYDTVNNACVRWGLKR